MHLAMKAYGAIHTFTGNPSNCPDTCDQKAQTFCDANEITVTSCAKVKGIQVNTTITGYPIQLKGTNGSMSP